MTAAKTPNKFDGQDANSFVQFDFKDTTGKTFAEFDVDPDFIG